MRTHRAMPQNKLLASGGVIPKTSVTQGLPVYGGRWNSAAFPERGQGLVDLRHRPAFGNKLCKASAP